MTRGRYIICGHLFSTGSFFMSEGKVFLLSILVWEIHDPQLIFFLLVTGWFSVIITDPVFYSLYQFVKLSKV